MGLAVRLEDTGRDSWIISRETDKRGAGTSGAPAARQGGETRISKEPCASSASIWGRPATDRRSGATVPVRLRQRPHRDRSAPAGRPSGAALLQCRRRAGPDPVHRWGRAADPGRPASANSAAGLDLAGGRLRHRGGRGVLDDRSGGGVLGMTRGSDGIRDDMKRLAVPGAIDREAPAVQGQDVQHAQLLCEKGQRRIGGGVLPRTADS